MQHEQHKHRTVYTAGNYRLCHCDDCDKAYAMHYVEGKGWVDVTDPKFKGGN